jgi:hypothetical protein
MSEGRKRVGACQSLPRPRVDRVEPTRLDADFLFKVTAELLSVEP